MTGDQGAPSEIRHVVHNRIRLAVHTLRDGEGRRLLILHGLGEATPPAVPAWLAEWPGPIHGLDFTGHGASDVPAGGGYTAELLIADVDAALALLGPVTIYGRGLGGYVGLLTAAARPELVHGLIIDDGPGLSGGSPFPGSPVVASAVDLGAGATPDPWALFELSRDVRPPEYALTMLRLAVARSEKDEPVTVVARRRPPWLAAVVDDPAALLGELGGALAMYAAG